MATAELDSTIIRVTCGYVDSDRMTQIPGSTHDRRTSTWKVPLSWASCRVLRGVFREDLVVGEQLKAWAWDYYQRHIEPAMALREAMELDPEHPVAKVINDIEDGQDHKLKPFQRADVAFLVAAERAGLFNEPGLGKTASLIRTLQVLARTAQHSCLPAVVVCPNSLKLPVWRSELAAWAPELTVQVIDGSAAARRKQLETPADIYILNWDLLRYHSRLESYGPEALTEAQKARKELNSLEHATMILDEAHHMLHPQSQQTKAAWAALADTNYRFALTGTPVGDHVGDLWGILRGILPDWFPGKTRYMDRYAKTVWNLWGGLEVIGLNAENAEEFHSITQPVMRRMLKAVVLPQLPPKLPVAYRYTPMTPKQAKAYREMRDEMVAHLDDELLIAPDPLVKLTRLLQFAAASAELMEDGRVRLSAPSSKVDDLIELLAELGDEPLVVAAVSRQLIELAAARLEKEGITHGLVTGAQPVDEREVAVREFQAGRRRVILLTLGTGAEGLTLTKASKLVFMQESWRTLENTQCEDRIHRIGSEIHDSIQIIKQVTPGTVEEIKQEVLAGKLERIEEVIRDREVLTRLLGTTEKKREKKKGKPSASINEPAEAT
jgi:SNF2 family DNA or RNA helicase